MSKSVELRVNGNYGLKQDLVPESYRLQVVGVEGAQERSGYVSDVTAWEYKYVAEKADEVRPGHDTKVAPGVAETGPKMAPAVCEGDGRAYAKERCDGKPPRGLEEAGKSDSTLEPGTPGLLLTMDDMTKLPRQELVTQFKCIEGWSEIVHWGGMRLRDFIGGVSAGAERAGRAAEVRVHGDAERGLLHRV